MFSFFLSRFFSSPRSHPSTNRSPLQRSRVVVYKPHSDSQQSGPKNTEILCSTVPSQACACSRLHRSFIAPLVSSLVPLIFTRFPPLHPYSTSLPLVFPLSYSPAIIFSSVPSQVVSLDLNLTPAPFSLPRCQISCYRVPHYVTPKLQHSFPRFTLPRKPSWASFRPHWPRTTAASPARRRVARIQGPHAQCALLHVT